MIRAKVLGRKLSERLSKPDLKATFSDVCLKTELRSNDLRIQVIFLEKPSIVNKCIVEIHGMDITSMNKRMTESNKRRPRLFCGGSEKSRFNGSRKSCFKIFLNFTYEKELTVSFISF